MDKNILLTHQIPGKIIEIIQNSKEYCFLVTPYFQPWGILERELDKAARDNKKIIFIFRDQDDARFQFSFLNKEYGFDLVFVDRLHTKLYLNEKEALLSSMNLYDSSKENNFEVGYSFGSSTYSREFKEQIIDDDILKSNPYIIKGRYFDGLDENEQDNYHTNSKEEGKCIRCGTVINYNESMPLCNKCYSIWSSFKNRDYQENYCHKCGKQDSWSNITFGNPLCQSCKSRFIKW